MLGIESPRKPITGQFAICINVEDNTFAVDACLLFFLIIIF